VGHDQGAESKDNEREESARGPEELACPEKNQDFRDQVEGEQPEDTETAQLVDHVGLGGPVEEQAVEPVCERGMEYGDLLRKIRESNDLLGRVEIVGFVVGGRDLIEGEIT